MKKLLKPALLLAALAVMVIGMLGSGAWFTDSATNTTASIKSGSLILNDEGITGTTLGKIENWEPGKISDPITILIKNDGTLNLAWFGNLVMSDSKLKDVIYIYDAKVSYLSPEGASWEVGKDLTTILPTDNFIVQGKGAGNWPTTWGGPENLATLKYFDNNTSMTPGAEFEFMGALKPGYSYKIELTFAFYEGAGNEYQSAGPLDLSFNVTATQVNQKALSAIQSTLGNHFSWMEKRIALQNTVP